MIVRQPVNVAGHCEQGDPVLVFIRPCGARGDDQHVGRAAVDNEGLLAAEHEAVARAFGARGDPFGAVFRAFVDRNGEDAVARWLALGGGAFLSSLSRRTRLTARSRSRQSTSTVFTM